MKNTITVVSILMLVASCKKKEPLPQPIADVSIVYDVSGSIPKNSDIRRRQISVLEGKLAEYLSSGSTVRIFLIHNNSSAVTNITTFELPASKEIGKTYSDNEKQIKEQQLKKNTQRKKDALIRQISAHLHAQSLAGNSPILEVLPVVFSHLDNSRDNYLLLLTDGLQESTKYRYSHNISGVENADAHLSSFSETLKAHSETASTVKSVLFIAPAGERNQNQWYQADKIPAYWDRIFREASLPAPVWLH